MNVIFTLLFYALIIFLCVNQSKKKKQQKQQARTVSAAAAPAKPAAPHHAKAQAKSPASAMQPSVTPMPPPVHDHDHPGSMGDLHDEGFDPCHEGELSPASDPATAVSPAETSAPASLSFSWTRAELVKGFVMGEILNRRNR